MTGGSTPSATELARLARIRRVAQYVGATIFVLALIVLVAGYGLDVAALRSVLPHLAPMKANTALALMCASASLFFEASGASGARFVRPLGAIAALIGAATLIEHAGLDLHIDQLLARLDDGSPHPGRISIGTSTALLLLGTAQASGAAPAPLQKHLANLARLSATIALIALIGYAYGVEPLYAFRPFDTIALHTAGCLFLLSIVFLRLRGAARENLFVVDGPGGDMLRGLLPAAVFLPALLGGACLAGMRAGYYGAEPAMALFATSSASVLAGLVFTFARRVQHGHHALRAQEEDLRITLESIGDGVAATDAEGRITRMNPVAEALTGWSLEEARGKPIDEVFRVLHQETRTPVENPVHRILREGRGAGLAGHDALLAKDGTERAIADSGAPIRDAEGALRGVVLVFRDQTKERRAREVHDRFNRLIEAGLFGVAIARFDGTIEEVNDEFLRIVGRSRDQFERTGLRAADLVDDAARTTETLAELEQKGIFNAAQTEYIRPDGSRIPVLRGGAKLENRRLIAFVLDRSAEVRAEQAQRNAERALLDKEEQLRQAQKMEAIGQLAGGVAHDFNNLLSVILSYASMMKADLAPGDPSIESAEEIEQAGLRAAQLTKQLLAFGRRQLLQPKALDLDEALRKMGTLLRRLIGEDVALSIETSGVPSVLVDPGQIEQVIMNLSVNARDAMPQGGRLTLATSETTLLEDNSLLLPAGHYVELSVTDTGSGIDPKLLPHIFEPFFTTKAMGKGTGLGLSTVFGIVSQSGGHIRVLSELGRGTTFRVLLPRAPTARPPSMGTPSQASLRPVGHETILLVEDDSQLRALGVRILERAGYRVLSAEDGEDGLRKARDHVGPIHLLLTDVVMPKMSGRLLWDAIVALRPDAKVIFMSGYTDDKVLEQGIAKEALPFLQKPVSPSNLLQGIRKALDG